MQSMLNQINSRRSYFLDNLTIVFIYLKLTEQIAWSWFFVLSPMLIVALLGFIVGFVLTLSPGFAEGGLK
jgi:uncharacterized membrane protein SpoIIM required for sporulation